MPNKALLNRLQRMERVINPTIITRVWRIVVVATDGQKTPGPEISWTPRVRKTPVTYGAFVEEIE
jgi:hypothetical protein